MNTEQPERTDRDERREALEDLRSQLKARRQSYAHIARGCGKSASAVGYAMRGEYPYYGSCYLPVYLTRYLEGMRFRVPDCLKMQGA